MKIDVTSIVRDHFATLYDARTGGKSISDYVIFFAIPATIGGAAFCFSLKLKPDFYNVTITFFGIFAGLLLNIQVAIFGIFQRKWDVPLNPRSASMSKDKELQKASLLDELNSNISYLLLFCCASLVCSVIFFSLPALSPGAPPVIMAMYAHFMLTLLMIIKRAHTLFQREYRTSP